MAKRSRRQRRQDIEKQKQFTPNAAPVEPPAAEVQSPVRVRVEEFTPAPAKMTQPAPAATRKSAAINFAHEYHYVFRELTTILIITVIMVAVMIGLSFTI